MPENSVDHLHESVNWLNIYPAKSEADRAKLDALQKQLGNLPDTQEIVLTLSDVIDTGMLKGKKVPHDDLKLLKEVFQYITEGIQLGVDEGVSLKLRRITDDENKRETQEIAEAGKPEKWSFRSGDYRGQIIGESETTRKRYPLMAADTGDSKEKFTDTYIPHERVGDTVHFLNKRIEELLTKKTDAPVVVVDIGAMYAMSLIELADTYKEAILAGKLILIATNIGLTRKNIDDHIPKGGNNIPQNYEELYKSAGQLVHFEVTDVAGLLGQKLRLPNGAEFSIEAGSVDIAHENWSISQHSSSLELDVAFLIDLVGDKGLIMSNRRSNTRGYGGLSSGYPTPRRAISANMSILFHTSAREEDLRQKQEKFKIKDIGHEQLVQSNRTLENHNYKLVEQIVSPFTHDRHELNYSFWLGKDTEPLHLYDREGADISIAPTDPTDLREKPFEVSNKNDQQVGLRKLFRNVLNKVR